MLNLMVSFPKRLWEVKMSPARRHVIRAFQRCIEINCHLTGPGWGDWQNDKPVRHNIERLMPEPECNALLWYKPLGLEHKAAPVAPLVEPHDAGVLTIETYNEAWWPDNLASRDVIANGTQLVICHHAGDMPQFDLAVAKAGCTVKHIPHCAEETVFAEGAKPHKQRDIDLLLTGAINDSTYPLRHKWSRIIHGGHVPGQTKAAPHPGYWMRDVRHCDETVDIYAGFLKRSRIHLVCGSVYRYPLAKYVESAMAGCLVIGDMPLEAPPEYDKMMVAVPHNASENELIDVLRYWVDEKQREEVECRAMAAQAIALEHYTCQHYATAFTAAIHGVIHKGTETNEDSVSDQQVLPRLQNGHGAANPRPSDITAP